METSGTHSRATGRVQPTPVRIKGNGAVQAGAAARGTLLNSERRVGLRRQRADLLTKGHGAEGESGESDFVEHSGLP